MQSSTTERISIHRYQPADQAEWDEFIDGSVNGTFLFQRDYMDYMRDRIEDCSLMFRGEGGMLLAVLPAYREGDTLLSHGRLTYGGMVVHASMRLPVFLSAFDECLRWLSQAGVRSFLYKPVPHIYHRAPAEHDRYALFLLGARCVRSGMLAVVDRKRPQPYQERRRRAVRKALQAGLVVGVSDRLDTFWEIVAGVLRERYATEPVHSLGEIEALRRSFPENIQLYACFRDETMLAGVLVYRSERVARAQYIASSAEGRKYGALDAIIDHLIGDDGGSADSLDLGTSDEQSGHVLNAGLIDWKEGFGARPVALEQYSIDVTAWRPDTLQGVLQ